MVDVASHQRSPTHAAPAAAAGPGTPSWQAVPAATGTAPAPETFTSEAAAPETATSGASAPTGHARNAALRTTQPFPWHVLLRAEFLPPVAGFMGAAWFVSANGDGSVGSWLVGFAFSAFVATLTAAVATSRWFRQWRARARLRHLRRLLDEGLLSEEDVERGRRAVVEGL